MEKIINAPVPEKLTDEYLNELLLKADICRAKDGKLFLWQQEKYWMPISKNEQSVKIRALFSEDWQTSLSEGRIQRLSKWIVSNPKLQIKENNFPFDVNLENGKFNLKTGALNQVCKGENFTYVIEAKYKKKEAGAQRQLMAFNHYCEGVFEKKHLQAKKTLLLQIIGWAISDIPNLKKAMFLVGPSCSGKSVIVRFLQRVIGEINISNVSLDNFGNRFSIAEMYEKKLNLTSEIPCDEIGAKNYTIFKHITGGDRIQAEKKGCQPFFFTPDVKLIFAGNCMPTFSQIDGSDAFFERVQLLLFDKTVPSTERDIKLDEKLWCERDLIISEALDLLRELIQNEYQFEITEEEIKYLDGLKKTANSVAFFVSDRLQFGKDFFVHISEAYDAYSEFTKQEALPTVGRIAFRNQLLMYPEIEHGGKKRLGKRNAMACFSGVKIKPE